MEPLGEAATVGEDHRGISDIVAVNVELGANRLCVKSARG